MAVEDPYLEFLKVYKNRLGDERLSVFVNFGILALLSNQ